MRRQAHPRRPTGPLRARGRCSQRTVSSPCGRGPGLSAPKMDDDVHDTATTAHGWHHSLSSSPSRCVGRECGGHCKSLQVSMASDQACRLMHDIHVAACYKLLPACGALFCRHRPFFGGMFGTGSDLAMASKAAPRCSSVSRCTATHAFHQQKESAQRVVRNLLQKGKIAVALACLCLRTAVNLLLQLLVLVLRRVQPAPNGPLGGSHRFPAVLAHFHGKQSMFFRSLYM